MALGEYVSVSSQRDTEKSLIEKERRELAEDPDGELEELAGLYRARGISAATARQAALEITQHAALSAHLRAELGIDQDDVVSPWRAAFASFVSFSIGAVLPLLAILLPGPDVRVLVTFVVTLVALGLTGYVGAWIGAAPRGRASARVVIGGALALAATFLVGRLLGTTGIAG
jgi:VIT1/CCC1 family predicted Fe2+/Mn2+ transporter